MSINVATKFKPGLKTALPQGSLKSVPKFNAEKTVAASSSGSSNSTSSVAEKSATAKNAFAALQNTTRQNAFVSGTRFVNPGDYTMHNVTPELTASIATGFAPTPRSVSRDINRMNKELQRYVNAMNMNNRNRSNGMDAMSTMGMLNQLGSLAGDVTKAVASTKASNSSPVAGNRNVNTASGAKLGGEVGNVLGDLATAKSSKEIETGLATVNSQIDSKTKLKEGYEAQITSDSQAKTEAEGQLGEIKTKIENTKTTMRGIDSQIDRLNGQLAMAGNDGNAAEIRAQLEQLKQQKADCEKQLADLQKQQQDTETQITNLDKSIKTNTASKEKVEGEISSLNSAKNEYTAKQTKYENSERKDLRDMNGKLTKLVQNLSKETDETKKQQMIEEYKNIASTYNAMVDNTTITGFQRVADEPVMADGAKMMASLGV